MKKFNFEGMLEKHSIIYSDSLDMLLAIVINETKGRIIASGYIHHDMKAIRFFEIETDKTIDSTDYRPFDRKNLVDYVWFFETDLLDEDNYIPLGKMVKLMNIK